MDELAKRFADLAEKYGPTVAEAAKGAARVEAYSCLASGALALGIAALMLWAARWLWRQANDGEEFLYFVGGFVGVCGAVLACIGLWQWVDPWTWTTIAHPELWIAKKAFHL